MECGEGRACGRDIRVCVKGTERPFFIETGIFMEKNIRVLAGSYRDE